jgi:hypothetical protein
VLARIFALLFISYFSWLLASLHILPHTRSTLLWGLLLMTLISAAIFLRQRQEIMAFIRANLGYLIVVELFGVALYLLAILIRLGNPDVWDIIYGGEKPMDLSFFTAGLKSRGWPISHGASQPTEVRFAPLCGRLPASRQERRRDADSGLDRL